MSLKQVDGYIASVESGALTVGKWQRLAVERHVRDLADGHKRGLVFRRDAAEYAINFVEALRHYKGKWAKQPLVLEPWQQFIVANLFGWIRDADKMRRFRRAYIEMARKNGKTTLAAALALIMFVADQEAGAEVYSAATKRDQAKIVFDAAKQMVKASDLLRRSIKSYRTALVMEATASNFVPLSADHDTMDGLNVWCAIIDELHAHKTRDLYDVLDTATGSRTQPMIVSITTAGRGEGSVCHEKHAYTKLVLDPASGVVDDGWFGFIAAIDDSDDWSDEGCWVKANPNLGVSVSLEDMRDKAARAKVEASYQDAFRRLHLGVWSTVHEQWIDSRRWDACASKWTPEDLEGRPVYLGLDLSSVSDLTAVGMVWPPEREGEPFRVDAHGWMPEETLIDRVRGGQVFLQKWHEAGLITTTPGAVIDYAFVREWINRFAASNPISQIGYDPYNAEYLCNQQLGQQDGLPTVVVRQGYLTISPACKEFERLVGKGALQHNGNPLLRWACGNATLQRDPAGNIKPRKPDKMSRDKIDPLVAVIIGLSLAAVHEAGGPGEIVFI